MIIQRKPLRCTNRGLTMLLQRTATRHTMYRNVLKFAVRVAAAEQQALGAQGTLTESMKASVAIDLVTKAKDGRFVLILVEEGPWQAAEIQQNLRALQNRLHTTLDAVLGGHLLERYPDSLGQPITLRVDAYGTPRDETEAFLSRYSVYVRESPEVRSAVAESTHVPELSFEFQWYSIAELEAGRRGVKQTMFSKLRGWLRRT